mmetsp:Transcript_11404/g.37727  ORF Transcript_11404/g.37727 Transcript_11404/m.37727 type:complete len:254 (-) Transcript_11404:265-1026(-)
MRGWGTGWWRWTRGRASWWATSSLGSPSSSPSSRSKRRLAATRHDEAPSTASLTWPPAARSFCFIARAPHRRCSSVRSRRSSVPPPSKPRRHAPELAAPVPAAVGTNEELVAKVTPPLPGAGSEVPRRRHGGVTLSLYPGSAPLPCVSLANAAADWAPGRSQLGVHRPRQRPTRTLTRSASQPTRVLYRGLPLATSAAAGGVLGRFNAAPRPLPSIATDGPDTLTRGASSPELLWRRGGTGSGHLARPALRRG